MGATRIVRHWRHGQHKPVNALPKNILVALSIQTLKICRVQSETSGIGEFGEIHRVYIGNLGFYHYLEIFGVLLNLRSLCKYNQWFCNYLSDAAKKVRV